MSADPLDSPAGEHHSEPWSRRRLLLTAAALLTAVLALRLRLELVGPLPGERWASGRFLW